MIIENRWVALGGQLPSSSTAIDLMGIENARVGEVLNTFSLTAVPLTGAGSESFRLKILTYRLYVHSNCSTPLDLLQTYL